MSTVAESLESRWVALADAAASATDYMMSKKTEAILIAFSFKKPRFIDAISGSDQQVALLSQRGHAMLRVCQ